MTPFRLLLTLGLVSVLIGCEKKPNAKPGDERGSEGEQKKSPATYKIKAEELDSEFEKNYEGAQAKYSGSVIEVSGTVSFLGLNGENAVVGLSRHPGEKRDTGSLIHMRGRGAVGKLALGQEVVIRCTWEQTGLSNKLADGVILMTGPDTAIRMTAEELAKQCTADPEGMEKRCRDRTLILQGEVDSGPNPGEEPLEPLEFVLKGDGKTRILCRISEAHKREVPVPAVGTTVTLVGDLWLVIGGKKAILFVFM